MELTDEVIHDAISMVLDSFSDSIKQSMLRPSGMVRIATKNVLLPVDEEADALKAALALAQIRQATTADGDVVTKWIFTFLCGYVYEADGSLSEIFAQALDDFTVTGYKQLTAHQIGVFRDELKTQFMARSHGRAEEMEKMASAAWVIGKRVCKHVRDGEALEAIFQKEWLTDEQL